MTVPGSAARRISWLEIPIQTRAAIEVALGGEVLRSVGASGGFTPGFAGRVDLAHGEQYFVKAIGASLTPVGPEIYRREAKITASLPAGAPVPRLLATCEDNEWVALIFEYVRGRVPDPTAPDDLVAVLDAVTGLSGALSPSPVHAPRMVEAWADDFASWRALEVGDRPSGLASYGPWVETHIGHLADLESGWALGADSDSLLHGDLRLDNMILTADRAYFVDWPEACIGSSWVDLVLMLPSMAMLNGGPDPEAVVTSHPLTRGVPKTQLDAVLAAIAGFFVSRSLLPPPPGLPTVREFQRLQARTALVWLRRRLDN